MQQCWRPASGIVSCDVPGSTTIRGLDEESNKSVDLVVHRFRLDDGG